MSKIKYYYNTKTLRYERYVEGWKKKVLRVLYVLATGVVFATVVIVFAYQYLDSPKEKQLRREISNLELNYSILNEKSARLESVLQDLQERDDNIYRVIFEAEPIPDEIRSAGYGGVNRYQKLDGFAYSDMIKQITKRIDKLSKQTVIQSQSLDEIWQLAKNKQDMLASIPAILPIQKSDLKLQINTSGFGYRIDPIYKTVKFHAGMDFVADVGRPVFATGNGKIIFAGADNSGYGNHVIINHGFGYQTLYAHFSKISCSQGQKVKRGDLIGYVGSTGKSVGPHLHYEVHKNGNPVNPVNFYFNDLNAAEYEQILKASQHPSQSFD
ncbi:MAG: M23 family metallopeptidase [Candidatus Competibacteraceae bacterium]|nr:M23 family metallopeptidase [Candidatus Competibacteraceae bacterium]